MTKNYLGAGQFGLKETEYTFDDGKKIVLNEEQEKELEEGLSLFDTLKVELEEANTKLESLQTKIAAAKRALA